KLTLFSISGMKYQMDSLVYEHGFRSTPEDKEMPYFFIYTHENKDALLLIYFQTKSNLLHVLVQTADYEYYKDIRDKLTGSTKLPVKNVRFNEFNCKQTQATFAPRGYFLDGIN